MLIPFCFYRVIGSSAPLGWVSPAQPTYAIYLAYNISSNVVEPVANRKTLPKSLGSYNWTNDRSQYTSNPVTELLLWTDFTGFPTNYTTATLTLVINGQATGQWYNAVTLKLYESGITGYQGNSASTSAGWYTDTVVANTFPLGNLTYGNASAQLIAAFPAASFNSSAPTANRTVTITGGNLLTFLNDAALRNKGMIISYDNCPSITVVSATLTLS